MSSEDEEDGWPLTWGKLRRLVLIMFLGALPIAPLLLFIRVPYRWDTWLEAWLQVFSGDLGGFIPIALFSVHVVAFAALTGVGFVMVALAIALPFYWISRAKPSTQSETRGTMRPEPIAVSFFLLIGAAMAVGSIAFMVEGYFKVSHNDGPSIETVFGALVLALSVLCLGWIAPLYSPRHEVTWDDKGVTGPTAFGLFLPKERATLTWDETTKRGETFWGWDYVETRDCRRVHWSYLHKGDGALEKAIDRHCQNIVK